MAEAEIRIKPRVVGNVKASVAGDIRAMQRFDRVQSGALRRAQKEARLVDRAYEGIGRTVRGVTRITGDLTRGILSVRNLVGGIVAGGAARTLFEKTIGSADDLKSSRRRLGLILKDQGKVNDSIRAAREISQQVASLNFAKSLKGVEKTALLAGGSVDMAKELVTVAAALEGKEPEQGFEGALFALKELESGDVMSLRERFNIRLPTRKEAEKEAKKAKKTLQRYYLDELNNEMNKIGGVDALLASNAQSIRGQFAMITTDIEDMLTETGKTAADVLGDQIPEIRAELLKLKTDPQFKEDVRKLSEGLADASKWAVKIAKDIPNAINSIRTFVSENKDLLKIAGTAAGAHMVTGGATTRLAAGGAGMLGRGLAGGASRLLFGKRGGGGGSALGAGMNGAIPVYVTNMGGGGLGGGDSFLGRNLSRGAKGAPLTTAGLLKSGGLAGTAQSIGAGGALGMLAIPGSFAAAALTFKSVVEKTSAIVDRYENRQTTTSLRGAMGGQAARHASRGAILQSRAKSVSDRLGSAQMAGSEIDRIRNVQDALKLSREAIEQASKADRERQIQELQKVFASYGLAITGGGNRLELDTDTRGVPAPGRDNRLALGRGILERASITINVQGSGDPKEDGAKAAKAFTTQIQREGQLIK